MSEIYENQRKALIKKDNDIHDLEMRLYEANEKVIDLSARTGCKLDFQPNLLECPHYCELKKLREELESLKLCHLKEVNEKNLELEGEKKKSILYHHMRKKSYRCKENIKKITNSL